MTADATVDAYTAAQAGRVLKVSPKRVHQFVEEDRLEVVGRQPLQVSQVSVLQLQQQREQAAATTSTGSEGASRSPGGSRRSPHPQTPSAELVPLLTSAFDRVQAADARTLEEHGLRMTAEAEARFLRDALHEARAAQTQAERELVDLRARVVHLEVVEAEVERQRVELERVRSEAQTSEPLRESDREVSEAPALTPPSPEAEAEVVRLRQEVAELREREKAQDAQWAQFRAVAAEGAAAIGQAQERSRAIGEAHTEKLREARRVALQQQAAPTVPPAQSQGLLARLFGRG